MTLEGDAGGVAGDVAGYMTAARGLLGRLVAFDTTSHLSNLDLIRFVETYLDAHGVSARLQFNAEATKANLTASIGPDAAGGIVLSGHTDVVPVTGQDWSSDPFILSERDGRLYGRGTADMKGFLAVALAFVPYFAKLALNAPVHLVLTHDEEVGCLGIQSLAPVLKDHVAAPRLVVVGEPTSMQVAAAHKGQHVYRTTVTGRAAHSSRTPDGVNAVVIAAGLIGKLTDMATWEADHGPRNDMFDPPYTTINVGRVEGGLAFNIVPENCWFDWDQRVLPGEDGSRVLNAFTAHVTAAVLPGMAAQGISEGVQTQRWAYLPPLIAEPGTDSQSLALWLAQRNETTVVAFGTEAGHFQAVDCPTVVCGPGDIAQAHKPDEYVTLDQLAACCHFMKRVGRALSGGKE